MPRPNHKIIHGDLGVSPLATPEYRSDLGWYVKQQSHSQSQILWKSDSKFHELFQIHCVILQISDFCFPLTVPEYIEYRGCNILAGHFRGRQRQKEDL